MFVPASRLIEMASVAAAPQRPARRVALPGLGAFRPRAATTPGRLGALAVALLVGAIVFGLTATLAEHARARAAEAARAQTEPVLLQAVSLYTALSDANATVSATFLQGGLEPPARRARYLGDIRTSTNALAALSARPGTGPEMRNALARITQSLPVYTGLVESARANNRQGFPAGAAYLRAASTLLTGTVLPAADHIYAAEARNLAADYGGGTASGAIVVLAAASVIALVLLLAAQRWLAGLSRRVFNVPMLVGTVLLVVVAAWSLIALVSEGSGLRGARRASDAVELLSASRVLVSRAEGDQALTLVNRGSDEADPADFRVVMAVLSPHGGLLSRVGSVGVREAGALRLASDFAGLRSGSDTLSALVANGRVPAAIASAPSTVAHADQLAADLSEATSDAQRRFTADASSAVSALGGLAVAIPLLTAAAAVLALLGVRRRLEEYR